MAADRAPQLKAIVRLLSLWNLRMSFMKTFLHIGVLTGFTVLFAGQSSREEGVKAIESKLLDVASASYKLKASYNGRGYEFCNASDARVVKFRLGCVKK
jgi:hypothetical protein